jgi:DNA-binding MarR family transcriptional regulator
MPVDIREANRSWEALLAAHATLMRSFADESIWREQGITMREYDVLYTLAKCDTAARVGELQQGVLLSQPALSRLVDRLAARGLVERVTDPIDGRAVRVRLTAAGAEVQRAVGRSHARSVERAMRALDTDEQRELARLATKLISNVPSSK